MSSYRAKCCRGGYSGAIVRNIFSFKRKGRYVIKLIYQPFIYDMLHSSWSLHFRAFFLPASREFRTVPLGHPRRRQAVKTTRHQHFRDFSPWSKIVYDLPRRAFVASNARYARIFHFRHDARAKTRKNPARGYKRILRLLVFARVMRLRSTELLICTHPINISQCQHLYAFLVGNRTYTALSSILSRDIRHSQKWSSSKMHRHISADESFTTVESSPEHEIDCRLLKRTRSHIRKSSRASIRYRVESL